LGSTRGVDASWQRADTAKAEEKEQMRVNRQHRTSHSSAWDPHSLRQ